MAPNSSLDMLDANLKATIQALYALQASAHGYLGPQTQAVLVQTVETLVGSLQSLAASAAAVPAQLPPEVIEYVDGARNPDVYTREFVELVQRGNAYLRAKSAAVAGLRDALADEIAREWPELEGEVGRALRGAEPEEAKGVNGVPA